jgi:hypothetical protein
MDNAGGGAGTRTVRWNSMTGQNGRRDLAIGSILFRCPMLSMPFSAILSNLFVPP